MKSFYRPTKARISLGAIKHNLQVARSCAGDASVIAVIKADAYGHGIHTVATALQQDADGYGIVSIDDAIQLREAGLKLPITCLSGFYSYEEITLLTEYDITVVVYDESQLQYLRTYAQESIATRVLNVWLKIDTGMGRLGFHLANAEKILSEVDGLNGINCLGILTHFANADEPMDHKNQQQVDSFNNIAKELRRHKPELKMSMSNSAALLSRSDSLFDLVRPGIMLYGASPISHQSAKDLNLQAAMTFASQLISVREVEQGSTIGYGSSWTAPKAMQVGVVAVGYGDGYPRHAPSGTPVLINGEVSQLLGRVSMDSISIDLSGISAQVGDEVILWGKGLPIEKIADCAGTIAYELLTGVTKRVPRVFED